MCVNLCVSVCASADNSIMTSCVNANDAQQETVYFSDRLPILFNKLAASMFHDFCLVLMTLYYST